MVGLFIGRRTKGRSQPLGCALRQSNSADRWGSAKALIPKCALRASITLTLPKLVLIAHLDLITPPPPTPPPSGVPPTQPVLT